MAETRFRDADGRLRRVSASGSSAAATRRHLNEKLLVRPGNGHGGQLHPSGSLAELADLWLTDLDLRNLADGTRQGYRDHFRLHVLPAFEHYNLAEITTGRVEWFLRSQGAYSNSRARQSRTLLNLMFAFALRHDARERNPVAGTSACSDFAGSRRGAADRCSDDAAGAVGGRSYSPSDAEVGPKFATSCRAGGARSSMPPQFITTTRVPRPRSSRLLRRRPAVVRGRGVRR